MQAKCGFYTSTDRTTSEFDSLTPRIAYDDDAYKGRLKENCDITIFQISNQSVSEDYRIIHGLNW